MRRLIWSGPARRDVFAIADYYGRIDPDLTRHILTLIEDAPSPLLDHPALGMMTSRHGTRKWPAHGTPYLLFYGASDTLVEIKRVRHMAENWQAAP